MFLNDGELRQLTGRQRASAQIRWLQDHGWKFTTNALGDPVVAIAEASRKLVGGDVKKRSKEPNWEAMHGSAA